jgi:hypothetical protein
MAVEGTEMADADRTVENLAIDIAGLLFEVRVAMAAVHFGIETLERRSETPTLAVELATLSELSDQACDALETLQRIVVDRLSPPSAESALP